VPPGCPHYPAVQAADQARERQEATMPKHDPSLHDPLTELGHAIQTARTLARAMRMDAAEQARLAFQVETAIDRAVGTLLQARLGSARV
jgi:hypothetical protein